VISIKGNGISKTIEFAELEPQMSRGQRFIFLDRDGTLVPYSPTPELAFLPPLTKTVLSDIVDHNQAQIAIVSARNLKSLASEFDPEKEILAGNYGLEISFPNGHKFVHPAASNAVPQITLLAEELAEIVAKYPQLILDNHHYSLCLHYHLLPPHKQSHVAALMEEIKSRYSGSDDSTVHFHDLPTSYEIVPAIEWDKGRALEQISLVLNLADKNMLYIAVGDTEADEPMFNWVNARNGLTFTVGAEDKISRAQYRLDSSDDLYAFLRHMLDLKSPGLAA